MVYNLSPVVVSFYLLYNKIRNMETNTTPPNDWDIREDEPPDSYALFAKYYLPLGLRRSLRAAYRQFLAETEPQRLLSHIVQSAPPVWITASRLFEWEKRAAAFDREQMKEAFDSVEEAAVKLRLAAPAAVDALIRELLSPRNAVAAAKEILDRAGSSTASMTKEVTFSAEELEQAERGLEEWMSSNQKSNG